jgi:hypothetical protein
MWFHAWLPCFRAARPLRCDPLETAQIRPNPPEIGADWRKNWRDDPDEG